MDECIGNENTCHGQSTCNNTIGSFTCLCNYGYKGNGTNCEGLN